MRSSHKKVASAILAVYNSEKTIGNALTSLLAQSEPIEIIVVDDGSTDNTITTIIRIIEVSKNPHIRLLKQNHQGPAIARNLGAKEASTNILLFVDADMVFDRHYVRKLIKPITNKEVIGTYTVEERVLNWDNKLARFWNYQQGWADRKRFPPNPPLAGTDYRAILKKDFEMVGGFDNIGYTDTWTLFQKLGVRPLATRAICYHKNPDTYKQVFHQAKWAAKRPYKLGVIGFVIALIRASPIFSFIVGAYQSIKNRDPSLIPFRIVYDLGRFIGIIEMVFFQKLSK